MNGQLNPSIKATAAPMPAPQAGERASGGVVLELVKARLTSLVLLTTLVGFYLGTQGRLDYSLMFHAVLATGLVAGGASALNQLLEREHDAKMPRTSGRPLPSGRVQPEAVLVFGGVCTAVGLVYLAAAINLVTCVLGAVTLVIYLLVYTPLKRITPFNTMVGAVPGALPPVMGWTASTGDATWQGWSLFAILFLWQIPHFLAIAWLYRNDYAHAGYAMLPVVDRTGQRTRRHVMAGSVGLLGASFLPFAFGLTGAPYAVGALLLSGAFIAAALRFCQRMSDARARQLFLASIIFLPLLLTLMVLDKMR